MKTTIRFLILLLLCAMTAEGAIIAVRYDTETGIVVEPTVFESSLTTPLIIGGTETTSDITIQTTSGIGTTGADMHFKVGNNGATEAMTVLNSGLVGIGTTGPSHLLTMSGGTLKIGTGTAAADNYTGRIDSILFNRADLPTSFFNKITNHFSGTAANTGMNFELTNAAGSGYATILALRGNGNVGVGGVTTPTAKLEAAGTISARTGDANPASTGSFTGLNLGFDVGAEHGWIQSVRNNAGETRVLEINPLGSNVLVGTTTDDTGRLQVMATSGPQLRLAYDGDNEVTVEVGSTGGVTLNTNGSGAAFSLSDSLAVTDISSASSTTTGALKVTGGISTQENLWVAAATRSRSFGGVGANPTIAAGAGAGTSPTVAITGEDAAGKLEITTGTSTPAGLIATITFGLANSMGGATYFPVFSPGNPVASLQVGGVYVAPIDANSWGIYTATGAPLVDSTAYVWFYHVMN